MMVVLNCVTPGQVKQVVTSKYTPKAASDGDCETMKRTKDSQVSPVTLNGYLFDIRCDTLH